MMKYKELIGMVLFFVYSCLIFGQAAKKESPSAELEKKLKKVFFEMNRLDRPGSAIVSVKNREILLKKGYGLASLEMRNPIDHRTVFDAAAISRTVTALAVSILVEQGKLAPTDSIHKYLKQLPVLSSKVTVADLLYHRSGLWDWEKMLAISGWNEGDLVTLDHVYSLLRKQKKTIFEPGSRFTFSHTNYTLLAEIVKSITRKDFREWTWLNIFRPLKMNATLFKDRIGEPVENQAFAYIYDRMAGYRRNPDNTALVGSNNLYTSIGDVAKLLQEMNQPQVFKQSIWNRMLQPGKLKNGELMRQCWGMRMDTYKGLKRYSASGTWQGYNATLQFFPNQQLSIVLLTNWESRWNNPVFTGGNLVDLFLEQQIKEAKVKPKENKKTVKGSDKAVDKTLFKSYTGNYRWNPGFNVKILIKGENLFIKFRGTDYPLVAESSNRFKLLVAPFKFIFKKNSAGQIDRFLAIRGNGEPEIKAKIKLVDPTKISYMDYVGQYRSDLLGIRFSIRYENEKLLFHRMRCPEIALKPESEDNFIIDTRTFKIIQFKRGKNGKLSGLYLDGYDGLFFKRIVE